jgi:hypothetical protein
MIPETKILEAIDNGLYTYETILKELLNWLPSRTVEQFIDTSFGNEGMELA